MQKTKNPLELHLFVCTNLKKDRECCAQKGAENLRLNLKNWTKEKPEWRGRVRINSSGCLDHCQNGIAIALFHNCANPSPSEILLDVKTDDLDQLKTLITSHLG